MNEMSTVPRQDTMPLFDSESTSAGSQNILSKSQNDYIMNELHLGSLVSAVMRDEQSSAVFVSPTEMSIAPNSYTGVISKNDAEINQQPPHQIDISTETYIIAPFLNEQFAAPGLPSSGSLSLRNWWNDQPLSARNSFSCIPTVEPKVGTGPAERNSLTNVESGLSSLSFLHQSNYAQPQTEIQVSNVTSVATSSESKQVELFPTSVYHQQNIPPNVFSQFDGFGVPYIIWPSGTGAPCNSRGTMDLSSRNEIGRCIDNNSPQGAQAPPSVSPVTPTGAANDIPSNVPYPGQFGFEIFFSKAKEVQSKKTISYTFSTDCNKLYVRQSAVCPVHFKVTKTPPIPAVIRAMAIYSRPQDIGDVVKRCMNHTAQDEGHVAAAHLIRTNHASANYCEDSITMRHSVSIPWEEPSPGSDHITGMYQFMCFSSCSGTINRRPIQIIFTLEHNNKVVGRQVIELRICACPGRDRQNDEEQLNPNKRKNQKIEKRNTITTVEPLAKKAKIATSDDEVYTVQVRGRELYKLVMTIVQNYQLANQYKDLVQSAQSLINPNVSGSERKFEELNNNIGFSAVKSLMKNETFGGMIIKKSQESTNADTNVAEWLESIEMSCYVRKFYENKLETMRQLDTLTMNNLEEIGIPEKDRDRLYASWLHYKAGQSTSQLSNLSTPPGIMQGAFKVSKTTVRQSYKIKRPSVGSIEQEKNNG